MEQWKGNPNIYVSIWHEKGGWAYRIEKRIGRRAEWRNSGFQTKEAAEEHMQIVLKSMEKVL